jgi:hypothetical protein
LLKKETYFKPRARLILQLGDQLIKNESIAVLELVKNSYDADARNVSLTFNDIDSQSKGIITIQDDGCGMDIDIIAKVWLEPGSDYKKKLFEEGYKTTLYGRTPIGEKGIGRFGAHKLGWKIELITRQKNKNEVVVNVNWRDFENEDYLDKIYLDVKERKAEIFKEDKSGTRICITDLQNEWDRNMLRRVYRSVFSLNSPFKKEGYFRINFQTNKPDWVEGLLDFRKIKKYALYYFHCKLKEDQITDFQYHFRPWENMEGIKERKINYDHSFIQESKKMTKVVIEYDEKTGRNKKILKNIDLSRHDIGEIDFEGYIFSLSPNLLSLLMESGKNELKGYLRENGGVRVYRNGIRINEYGEKGNDWLNLDAKRVNIPGEKISNNLILATVEIDREKSTSLEEKTNREGFVEDEAYRDFTDAINYTLNLIESLRVVDKELINEKFKSSKISEPVIDELKKLRDSINDKIKDSTIKEELTTYVDNIQKEYSEINEILLMSAGAGLSLSIVLHEIEKIMQELNSAFEIEKVPQKIIKLVKHLSELIKGYGGIIRQSSRKEESMKELIKATLFNIEFRCENHHITVYNEAENYKGDDIIKCSKRLVLGALLNIIDNSIYWLDFKERQLSKVEKFKKKILIKILDEHDGYLKVLIANNGKKFTIPTDKAIKPFISEKPDGMGLGLHITNEIMKSHKGKLIFPEYGDYNIPEEYQKGAQLILSFKI